MAVLKPWYKIDGLTPREDLREGKPLDASEFAFWWKKGLEVTNVSGD